MTDLPVRSCIRSGYCCKVAICPYGEWDLDKGQCKFLGKENGEYVCGKYEIIQQKPGSDISPAFGAGCCSPMNTDRQKLLKERV